MAHKVKAVIFDQDGLMFDTEKVFIKAWDYAGERIGIGKAGYMVYKTLGMSIVASYEIWNEEFGEAAAERDVRAGIRHGPVPGGEEGVFL